MQMSSICCISGFQHDSIKLFPQKRAKRAPLLAKKGAGKARASQIFGEATKKNPIPPESEESEEEDEQIASELAEHR